MNLRMTVAIEHVPGTVNGQKAARLYVCVDGETTQVYESLSNGAIEGFNSWLEDGYRAVRPGILFTHTDLSY